jgi:nucleotide-binding universal stress UspA family protein
MGARVAVTVDGTPACAGALQQAVARARSEGCGLTGVFLLDAGWADFIGNDWQSSRNSRQGFLDYVMQEQQRHAEAARGQFAAATLGLPDARFAVLAGDPADELVRMMNSGAADVLFAGENAFRECGRPSSRAIVRTVVAKVRQPVHVV